MQEKDTPEEDAEWYRKEVGAEPDQGKFRRIPTISFNQ